MTIERYDVGFLIDVNRDYGRKPTVRFVGPSRCVSENGKTSCGCYAHSFYCDQLCGLLDKLFGTDHSVAKFTRLEEVSNNGQDSS